MGDRCYMDFYCRVEDKNRLLEALGENKSEIEVEIAPGERQVAFSLSECNYALYSELHEAAEQGINFFGDHSPGGSYPAGSFVSYRGKLFLVDTDGENNCPVIKVYSNGKFDKETLKGVRQYWKKYHAVKKWMGE